MLVMQLNTQDWMVVSRNGVVACFAIGTGQVFHAHGGAAALLVELAAGALLDANAVATSAPELHQELLSHRIVFTSNAGGTTAALPNLSDAGLVEVTPVAEAAAQEGLPDEWRLPAGPHGVRLT